MDTLDIGTVHFPTGTILACDPLIELEDALPYIQTVPAGTYPVTICVVPNENYGNRYACVKVYISNKKPIRYEIGMVGNEDLDEEIKEDEFFGFSWTLAWAVSQTSKTQEVFKKYWTQRENEEEGIDPL